MQAVEEAIEFTRLQNFPGDILMCPRKAFGFGTPEMTNMTSMMNPTAGEFYVVKLFRFVLHNYSKRETAYEMKERLRRIRFDPFSESVTTFINRVDGDVSSSSPYCNYT